MSSKFSPEQKMCKNWHLNPEPLILIVSPLANELSGRHYSQHNNHTGNHLIITFGLLYETARQNKLLMKDKNLTNNRNP